MERNKRYEITTKDGFHVATTWAISELEARTEHHAFGSQYIVEECEKSPCDEFWQHNGIDRLSSKQSADLAWNGEES